jgi:hypothetical protein
MSFYSELLSWMTPTPLPTSDAPKVGAAAPSSPALVLPCGDAKPALITFLRHCGCPFSELALQRLRDSAPQHQDIHFIAISHSSEAHTKSWLESVGGSGDVGIIVDEERKLYAMWGLGTTGWWHVLSPFALFSVFKLAWYGGIKNRPTESGNRWQAGGSWLVDGNGTVLWGTPMASADEVPDFESIVKRLE